MKMQNTYKGYWSIVKGKTRILVHPGQSNPYKPTSFIYNTDPPCIGEIPTTDDATNCNDITWIIKYLPKSRASSSPQ